MPEKRWHEEEAVISGQATLESPCSNPKAPSSCFTVHLQLT